MCDKGIDYVLIFLVTLVLGLGFMSPIQAANCGGTIPCACGDNLVANRTLTAGVDPIIGIACPNDGLVIINDGIVLTLGGNKLVGSGTGVGVLIDADNVTVENGGVNRFETGIGSNNTIGSTIENVRLDANTGDGIFVQGNNNEFIAILAKRSGDHGVRVIGNSNTLQGHNDEYSGFDGIRVEGDNNQLIANLASENAKKGSGNGITVIGNGNTLDRNRMTKLNINGIAVSGANNTLVKNQVTKQRSDGITVEGDNNRLTDNKTTDNRGVGFIVTGNGDAGDSTGNIARNNRTDPQCSIYGETSSPTCIIK